MVVRLEEMFQLIERELVYAGLLDFLRAGVFLCGGGARIPQIDKLAERIFKMPATLGKTTSLSGLKSALDQPEFATAMGLVKFGSINQKKRTRGGFWGSSLKSTLGVIFKRGGNR
jgi:cell division protein FtsA